MAENPQTIITIVYLTYNNESHVSDAIASIKTQSISDWECICVDNDSSDRTVENIKTETDGDPRFTLLRKRNEGPSAARNYGQLHASIESKFIHFLDGDDFLHEDFLKETLAEFESNPQCGLVACQFKEVSEDGKTIRDGFRSRYAPSHFGIPTQLRAECRKTPFQCFFAATGQGPFAVFRLVDFRSTTGYEERFWSHEDSDIFCQLALRSEVRYLPSRLYFKRTAAQQLTGSSRANYSIFREKWDVYTDGTTTTHQLIRDSLIYYYGWHCPLRDFKIAMKAARGFVSRPSFNSLRWSCRCFSSGIRNLVFRRAVKEKLRAYDAKVLSHKVD